MTRSLRLHSGGPSRQHGIAVARQALHVRLYFVRGIPARI